MKPDPEDIFTVGPGMTLLEAYTKAIARVAELEKEQTGTLFFMTALIQVAGGIVTVPDEVLLSLDRKTMLIREDNPLLRSVTVRIRKP